MTTATVLRVDDAIAKFVAALEWPDGVPLPAVDAILVDATKVMVRFTAVAGAPPEAPADFTAAGDSPWTMIAGVATLCEAWCRRFQADPGRYPTGVKAQVINRLDIRTAGAWLYSMQLAGALAVSSDRL